MLQVPVPALEAFVRGRYRHYDPAYLGADPGHRHAHITALGPFLEPARIDDRVRAEVAAIVVDLMPFDYVLDRVDTFPDGIIHLRADPEEPFRELTSRLAAAYPECPPYGGRYGDVVPHLTLDRRSATVTESSVLRAIGRDVPIPGSATRLDLAWYQPYRSRLLHSWHFDSAAG